MSTKYTNEEWLLIFQQRTHHNVGKSGAYKGVGAHCLRLPVNIVGKQVMKVMYSLLQKQI